MLAFVAVALRRRAAARRCCATAQLLFATFDPEVADASGVRTARLDALLMVVLAASILATMQVLGVTLIAATLVIPATVARMLTELVQPDALALAPAIGAACGFVGMNVSYHLDVQSGTDDRADLRRCCSCWCWPSRAPAGCAAPPAWTTTRDATAVAPTVRVAGMSRPGLPSATSRPTSP